MKADLQFDFIVDRERNTLTVKREFAAKRQLVWDCYTQSDLLDQWFAPKPFTTETKVMDFREGGYWHYAMIDPAGHAHWGRMDYLVIRPVDSYSAVSSFSDKTGEIKSGLPSSTWDVTFAERSGHTFVETVVTYKSAEDLETVIKMGMEAGLTSTLECLDELLLALGK